MKQIMLILSLLFVINLQAQKDIKLYGFSQGVSKGIRKTNVDEQGEIRTDKKSTSKILHLFLEFPVGMNLTITELCINGEKFHFDTTPEKTPVVLNTGLWMPGQKETILIQESTNEIVRITPGMKIDGTKLDNIHVSKRKSLVVFYKVNGRAFKKSLDQLEVLPELTME